MLRFQLWDCVATTQDGGESLILLYGRTSVADGDRDLCLRVSGLYAYIYIPQPAQTSASSSPVEALDKALARRGGGSVFRGAELVRRTGVVGFSTPANFWKLTLRDHRAIYNLKELVNNGEVASNFSRKSYLTDFPCASSLRRCVASLRRAAHAHTHTDTRRLRKSYLAFQTAAGARLTTRCSRSSVPFACPRAPWNTPCPLSTFQSRARRASTRSGRSTRSCGRRCRAVCALPRWTLSARAGGASFRRLWSTPSSK